MHRRFVCGIGTILTLTLLMFSTPDSKVDAGWRHRRGGCGGGAGHRLLGGGGRWGGGGCHGRSHCGHSGGGGGCYAQPVYDACGSDVHGGGYGYGGDMIAPSCAGVPYDQSNMGPPTMQPGSGSGSGMGTTPPPPPSSPSNQGAPSGANDAASGNVPPAPTSTPDAGA